MRTLLAIPLLGLALGASTEVLAQGKGKGSGKAATQTGAVVAFTLEDKKWIRATYAVLPVNQRPPGFPKGGKLPPGLVGKILRGGKLPPGWAARLAPFPQAIERRMPLDPPGIRRGYIEGHAVIIDTRTEIVLDVFIP
jgi:hypothetical protein